MRKAKTIVDVETNYEDREDDKIEQRLVQIQYCRI